ncbi:MAG: sigma-70 family RNA polymerase sigma factor [Deltaproteobacteria bacterium]|nr:sigma-70 family RNA polymerase sigma factor [Deltaproteobacteria bacterium]
MSIAPEHLTEEADRAFALALARCRTAHPRVALPGEGFLALLRQRVAAQEPVAAALGKLHLEDLYLACGCLQHDSVALTELEGLLRAKTRDAVARMGPTRDILLEEVGSLLQEQLLVAPLGAQPKLAEYSGRGPLGKWIEVIAVRAALRLRRQRQGRSGTPVEPELVASPAASPESACLRARCGAELSSALRETLEGLEEDERRLLRLYFVEGKSIDEIGEDLAIHRATAARRLARARAKVFEQTRDRVAGKLRLEEPEFRSLVNLVRSQLDLSIQSCLRSASDSTS